MNKNNSVLVIDDDNITLTYLTRIFENEAIGVVATQDAQEAFRLIKENNIKVILCDQFMPGITGIDFFKIVKNEYPNIIRILITGAEDFETIKAAINIVEIYRFINKPFDQKKIKFTVSEALNHFDLASNSRLLNIMKDKNEQLEKLHQNLKAVYEKQKEFTSVISHELRTPLTSMKAGIDILLSRTTGDLTDHQREFLVMIQTDIGRLSKLINDILDLSKIELHKFKIERMPHDVNGVITDSMKPQKLLATEKGLEFRLDLQPELPTVYFDRNRITQVLSNIVQNAIKFTEDGFIEISSQVSENGKNVIICTHDTGHGIRKTDLDKIFRKFHQLDLPLTNSKGGIGLGLAICMEIMEMHDGNVWVESEFGQWSKFYISLPIRKQGENYGR